MLDGNTSELQRMGLEVRAGRVLFKEGISEKISSFVSSLFPQMVLGS